jgi:hypothetical protein
MVARAQRETRRYRLAEITPMHRSRRNGEDVMFHEVPLDVAGARCMRAQFLFKRSGLSFGSCDDIERGVSAHHAQEFGRQLVARLREHLMRRTVLDHLATCQKHNAVGDLIGEAKLMG